MQNPEGTPSLLPNPLIRRISNLTSATLILVALAVMAGWQFRIPILRGQVLGSFVAPNTALCFFIFGIAILLQDIRNWAAKVGAMFGLLVAIFAALVLFEYLTGIDLNIDRSFFAHRLDDWSLPTPGRFAITTTIAFFIGGIGVLFLKRKSSPPIADVAGCLVLGVAYVGIIGHLFGFKLLYGRVMAAPTAVFCAVLGFAILSSSHVGWVIGALTSQRPGGLLMRRLTLAVFIGIPALGVLETWLEGRKLLGAESGMALLVLSAVTVFAILVLRTAAVMNSIDEAKEAAQHRASALSQELGALIEASPVGIVRFREDLTVSGWSAAAERILGWQAGEIIGTQLPVLHDASGGWSQLMAKLTAGATLANIETRQIRKDGTVMDALVSGAPIRDGAGRAREFIGIIADSTELNLAKDALIRTEKLSAAGRLAATIAHEINNPLEAITNLLYLARTSPDNTQNYLELADQELARVVHLTKQTLGFYRDSSTPGPADIDALAEGVLNIYAAKCKGKNIRVVKQLAAAGKINTVPGEVRQVLSNLIANAIDACANQGVITVRTRGVSPGMNRACGACITVADNGSGIEPALRAKIWEPFFTTKKEIGTGLGLWVCKQIIEKHSGSIRVRSNSKGTAFTVYLPSLAGIQAVHAAGSGVRVGQG